MFEVQSFNSQIKLSRIGLLSFFFSTYSRQIENRKEIKRWWKKFSTFFLHLFHTVFSIKLYHLRSTNTNEYEHWTLWKINLLILLHYKLWIDKLSIKYFLYKWFDEHCRYICNDLNKNGWKCSLIDQMLC